jgi:hypothetical protein
MQSLREQFRPVGEGMSEADAIDRWELASALGDENAAARAQRAKEQARLSAQVNAPDPEPANPVLHYAKEVSALRAEVAELRQPRKRKLLDKRRYRHKP